MRAGELLDMDGDGGESAGGQRACAGQDGVLVGARGDDGGDEGGVGVCLLQRVPDRVGIEQSVEVVHRLADAGGPVGIIIVGEGADVDAHA